MSFASPWFLLALLLVPLGARVSRSGSTAAARVTPSRSRISTCSRRSAHGAAPAWRVAPARAASCSRSRRRRRRSLVRRRRCRVPSDQATIVLLVDVSGSMRADDVKPTRLGAAQAAMDVFADKVPKGVRIGLVSFSSAPDLLVIPTTDRSVLHEGIDLLVPEAGTAIGDGLGDGRPGREDIARRRAEGQGRQAAGCDRPALGRRPDARRADAAAGRGARPQRGHPRLHGRARHEERHARRSAAARSAATAAASAARATLPGAARPGDARGDRARNRRADVPGASRRRRCRPIYKQLGASIAHPTTTREVSSWFAGIAALLLLASLGAAPGSPASGCPEAPARQRSRFELAQREEDAFAEGGVGLDHVEQHLDRRLGADRERQLLEPLARLGADGDRAREDPPLRVGDDLDEAGALRPLVGRRGAARR